MLAYSCSYLSQFICIFIYICNISLNILQLQHVTPQDRSPRRDILFVFWSKFAIFACLFLFAFVWYFCYFGLFLLHLSACFCSNCLQGLKMIPNVQKEEGEGAKAFQTMLKDRRIGIVGYSLFTTWYFNCDQIIVTVGGPWVSECS